MLLQLLNYLNGVEKEKLKNSFLPHQEMFMVISPAFSKKQAEQILLLFMESRS